MRFSSATSLIHLARRPADHPVSPRHEVRLTQYSQADTVDSSNWPGEAVLKVAVLSDIHGNAPALRAVLDELQLGQPDVVVCCGDIAAGPMPRETIEELRGLGDRLIAVRGNADREVVEVFDGHGNDDLPPDSLWAGQQITQSQRDWLVQLPATVTLELAGLGVVLFCHATPRDDSEVVVETTADEDLLEKLGGVDADVIVCGNTHMQFDRHVDGYRVVNVGSVGMPYGDTGAFWVVLDRDVKFRRTKYDLASAAQTIRSHSDWDMADAFAEENVMRVPTQEEALSFFESLR